MVGDGDDNENNVGDMVVGFIWIGVGGMFHGGQRNGGREYTSG
jgi:hypothetical protein